MLDACCTFLWLLLHLPITLAYCSCCTCLLDNWTCLLIMLHLLIALLPLPIALAALLPMPVALATPALSHLPTVLA